MEGIYFVADVAFTPGKKLAPKTNKQINKYLKKAYQVYSGQKPYQVVAQISEDVTKKTGLPKDIVVSRAFFDHVSKTHPEIPKKQLFSFVKTLNIPDEIYKLPYKEKLNFFRTL